MQNAIGRRRSLVTRLFAPWIAVLIGQALVLPVFANSTDPSCPSYLLPDSRLQTFDDHPFFKGEKIQVMEITSPNGDPSVYVGGLASAMKHVGPESAAALPVVEKVVGPSNDQIEIATGLNGSAARYALFGSANDLDILAQLVVKVKQGDTQQLFNSRSAPIQTVTRYLQNHVEQVLKDNPTYRFIELKAGEYLDPVSGETQGIKWWLDDLRRGYKFVKEPTGTRRVSLAQALAEPARIKVDWAVPSPMDALNPFDYTEVTTIYLLGMKVGNNQARLRVSNLPGSNESLLIKATSINLSREDLLKSIEASEGENPTTLEHVHQSLIKTIEKYTSIDRLKVLKRLFALLSFWENPVDFALSTGIKVQSSEILAQVHSILADEKIKVLSRIRSRADVRMISHEHGLTLGTRDEDWIAAVKKDFDLKGNTLEELDSEVAARIEAELTVAFNQYPHIPEYIDFVRKRAAFVVGQTLTEKPVFLTLKPNATFRAALAKKIRIWKDKYPALSFVDPEDAHMTIHYSGRLSGPAMDAWIQEARSTFTSIPDAKEGGLYLMGRQSQVIAIKFPGNPDFSEMAKSLRAFSTSVGGFPEKTFLEFTPHITLASIKDRGSIEAQAQVRRFLAESTGTLSTASFEKFEIWTSGKSVDPKVSPRKYSVLR